VDGLTVGINGESVGGTVGRRVGFGGGGLREGLVGHRNGALVGSAVGYLPPAEAKPKIVVAIDRIFTNTT